MKVIAFEGVEGGASLDLRAHEPTSPARPASTAERMIIARMVAARAQRAGAAVERLDILSPYGPAVVLVVRVDDPASFLRHRFMPMIDGWSGHPRLEGSYVLVRDGDGRTIEEVAYASRLTGGSSFVRRDLAGCDPIVHYSVMRAPPPCPAD